MADLTRDDVLKLAQLARIDLTDDEVTGFVAEFNEILGYVQQLQNVDVTGLKPTSQVTGLTNVSRTDDIIDYGYNPEDLLAIAPVVDHNQIKVKRMIG